MMHTWEQYQDHRELETAESYDILYNPTIRFYLNTIGFKIDSVPRTDKQKGGI